MSSLSKVVGLDKVILQIAFKIIETATKQCFTTTIPKLNILELVESIVLKKSLKTPIEFYFYEMFY